MQVAFCSNGSGMQGAPDPGLGWLAAGACRQTGRQTGLPSTLQGTAVLLSLTLGCGLLVSLLLLASISVSKCPAGLDFGHGKHAAGAHAVLRCAAVSSVQHFASQSHSAPAAIFWRSSSRQRRWVDLLVLLWALMLGCSGRPACVCGPRSVLRGQAGHRAWEVAWCMTVLLLIAAAAEP